MIERACVVCGRFSPETRCPEHRLRPRSSRPYRRERAAVLAHAARCAICGRPPTPDDPLEADHVTPRAHGGPDVAANLRPAHRSCNLARGAGR